MKKLKVTVESIEVDNENTSFYACNECPAFTPTKQELMKHNKMQHRGERLNFSKLGKIKLTLELIFISTSLSFSARGTVRDWSMTV